MTLRFSVGRPRWRHGAFAFSLITTVSVATATGDVIYVDDDADLGGDGLTWMTAYTHLQDALDAAQPGSDVDEIRVGQGEYRPDRSAASPLGTGDRTASFDLIPAVTIAGGYAGVGAPDPDARDIAKFETVLSGDLEGDDSTGGDNSENSHHVLRADFLAARGYLSGVAVRAGNTTGGSFANGGGLRIAHSPVTVSDCSFVENASHATSGSGGAISAGGGPTTIERCTFTDNRAVDQFSTSAGGGALWIIDETTVIDSVFTGNSAWNGGAVFVTGDALIRGSTFNSNSAEKGGAIFRREFGGPNDLTVVESMFSDNAAGDRGGAMHFESGDAGPRILNSRFVANDAGGMAGAISQLAPGAILSNCLFAGNTAGQFNGGAVTTQHPGIKVFSSTFVGNIAGNKGGGLHQIDNNPPALTNTIFRQNEDATGTTERGQIAREAAGYDPPVVNYCLVQGLTGEFGGDGNIDADPLFTDPDGPDNDPGTFHDNDYAISAESPCVDAGHNWGETNDEADLDEDGDVMECTPADLDGASRFTDCAPVDTGCGAPVVVDIGAFEADGAAVNPIIVGDIDADGRVTFGDLVIVLGNWGDDPGNCLADLDLDGAVTFTEILILLGNW